MALSLLVCTAAVAGASTFGRAGDQALLITYGQQAPIAEGDDDKLQVVVLRVPDGLEQPLYLRLFDADCGGANNTRFGTPDTTTRMVLRGGDGAYVPELEATSHPSPELLGGAVLAEMVVGDDPGLDDRWMTWVELRADQGQRVGEERVLVLQVQGLEGDDGNAYAVALSTSAEHNRPPDGLRMTTPSPTLRLTGRTAAAEMRVQVPEGADELVVHSFDTAGARTTLETPWRSLPVRSAGQGETSTTRLVLEPDETGGTVAMTFYDNGAEDPNDATFWLETTARQLAGCDSVSLDASASTDPDDPNGRALSFTWDLGDGATAEGGVISHAYAEPGTYLARLEVRDGSGSACAGARDTVRVRINGRPEAVAGDDREAWTGGAHDEVHLDATASSDPDGDPLTYSWDLGDGTRAQGPIVRHSYREPGTYPVRLEVRDGTAGPCGRTTDELVVTVRRRGTGPGADR